MSINVVTLINPTKKDFVHTYNGEEYTVPAGETINLPEAAAYDFSYHLAQRILDAKGLPFFGEHHQNCQAELMGLKEPTYFEAKVVDVKTIPTRTGKRKDVKVELEEDKLMDVPDAPEIVKPEENAKPVASNKEEGITLD